MFKWKVVNNTYLYDGSMEGFLTAVSQCLKLKTIPENITIEEYYLENLFETPVYINTDYEESIKITQLINNISSYCLYNVYTAFLSKDKSKEIIILKYILCLWKYGNKFNFMKNNDSLIAINSLSKKVARESHRLKGFLRFREISNNILYADIEPDNNITEVLAKHFKERLKNELWVIHDKRRNIVAIYDRNDYLIINVQEINLNQLINNNCEENYKELWKDYFNNITIKERKNLRCQMNFMPKKYWKYLTEMEEKQI